VSWGGGGGDGCLSLISSLMRTYALEVEKIDAMGGISVVRFDDKGRRGGLAVLVTPLRESSN